MFHRADRRGSEPLSGPFQIGPDDMDALNDLFSSAFTERYRRDGLVGVRVPPLNPAIWRYAIEGAGAGAMLWRDAAGALAAFNIAHASGDEGWMGPLAVRDDCQGAGQGKTVVRAGIAHLVSRGCRTIGLETMPRTMDNIGFYSRLGFVPGAITITLTLDAGAPMAMRGLMSQLDARERDDAVEECRELTAACAPGADYSREIRLTQELALGDTLMLRRDDNLAAFALCHAAPLVEGRPRDELRVLKLVALDLPALTELTWQLAALARRAATARVAIRVQGNFPDAYAALTRAGGRVRWTDLRMSLAEFPARAPERGIVFSNWEI